MSAVAMEAPDMQGQQLFTCLSCSIAFHSAEDQRVHYRSDYHRYNMKRRVAGLAPVTATVFNQKILDRKAETAIQSSTKGSSCDVCNKTYTTENAYRSHINSKKHRENELKAIAKRSAEANAPTSDEVAQASAKPSLGKIPEDPKQSTSNAVSLNVAEDASEETINQTIDEKIAAARARLSTSQCLFCSTSSPSLEANLTHMSTVHSFFIPDAEYLININGLITYLGEKIAIGNVCLYCNGKGREFRTLHAVRKHMVDKSHCKIAYDTERDRLEISDFYDFSSSYPDYDPSKAKKEHDNEEWEDVDSDEEDGEVDEVVDEDASPVPSSEEESDSEEEDNEDDVDSVPENQLSYGDSQYELVLPSGARIGHRAMKRYYGQSFRAVARLGSSKEDPNSGAAIVRRLLADKNSALVPAKGGGYGAFGSGMQVVKARNRGEAKEAGRHTKEFRDMKRREDFKTKVAFIHNNQKHFRDPLLQ